MELEISIEDLLSKRRVESDRIEFKAGWNPDDIYFNWLIGDKTVVLLYRSEKYAGKERIFVIQ